MSLASEIERLTDLHHRGALSDEEFARAKAALLTQPPDVSGAPPPLPRRDDDGEDDVPPRRDPAAREREARQWAMFVHLSLLLGLVVPLAGFVVPIVLWQTKKAEVPGLDAHGKAVVNWMISAVIYGIACVGLAFVIVGIPLLIALGVVMIVFPILGGVKASEGTVWRYPLSIPFLS
jgi:uncharacterized Tic20 family protein